MELKVLLGVGGGEKWMLFALKREVKVREHGRAKWLADGKKFSKFEKGVPKDINWKWEYFGTSPARHP